MSTSILHQEFGIRGYRFESAIRSEGTTMYVLSQERQRWRWLLLKNPENLEEPERLNDALELNHTLFVAYYLKDQLRLLWAQSGKWAARRRLDRTG